MRAAETDGAEGSARTRAPEFTGIIRAGLKKGRSRSISGRDSQVHIMHPFARGAAFVDRTGAVVAPPIPASCRIRLAPGAELTGAMRERAESAPELRAFSPAKGPTSRGSRASTASWSELQRVPSGEGSPS